MRTVVEYMPPDRPGSELEEEIATMLVAIERNYQREGSGRGSRFAGQRLEIAQAKAVVRRLTEGIICCQDYAWTRGIAHHPTCSVLDGSAGPARAS